MSARRHMARPINLWQRRITPIYQQIILQKDPKSAKAQKNSPKAPDALELYLFWRIVHMKQIRKHRDGTNTFKKVIKKHHSFISTCLLRRKSRGIIQSYILESKMTAALQGLNLPPKPGRDNCSPSHPLPSPLSNPLEKLSHLISITSRHTPLVTLLRRSRSPLRKSGSMVIDIKPLCFPIPNLTAQSIWDILLRHTRAKLEISTPHPSYIPKIGTRIQGKETFEKIKMAMNPKKRLT